VKEGHRIRPRVPSPEHRKVARAFLDETAERIDQMVARVEGLDPNNKTLKSLREKTLKSLREQARALRAVADWVRP